MPRQPQTFFPECPHGHSDSNDQNHVLLHYHPPHCTDEETEAEGSGRHWLEELELAQALQRQSLCFKGVLCGPLAGGAGKAAVKMCPKSG